MLTKQQLNIGLSMEDREEIVKILNTILADEHILYMKLRNYHWNVVGPHFIMLHELFERQYNEVKEIEDELAEQARALGGQAIGTMAEFSEKTRLEDPTDHSLTAARMIRDLVNSNQALIRHLREDIHLTMDEYGDEGTADLLIETLNKHAEMAWMLSSLLEDGSLHGENGYQQR